MFSTIEHAEIFIYLYYYYSDNLSENETAKTLTLHDVKCVYIYIFSQS